ncbi:hypothetical protein IW261DRAFT_1586877, partial [Armillaria novae-zelandiae]
LNHLWFICPVHLLSLCIPHLFLINFNIKPASSCATHTWPTKSPLLSGSACRQALPVLYTTDTGEQKV